MARKGRFDRARRGGHCGTTLARIAAAAACAAGLLVSPASAAPGDLDPSFGSGGLVVLPSGDRYQAEDAPLVASDGSVIAAGLLRNASDRVFLTRLGENGAVDTSYGGGSLHTNVIAAGRQAATARTPDGKTLVAGAGESAGKITVERFSATGVSERRISLDLGGTFARPTAIVALAGGKSLVSVATDAGGGAAFMVLRLTATGLDTTFGVAGKARTAFTGAAATARDLRVLSDGSILVAGSVGTEGATASDTGLVRLKPSGLIDTAFGDAGRKRIDLSRTGTADHAAALAVETGGGFAVTGPAGSDGFVARLTSVGALDSTFGSGGVQKAGLAAPMTGGASTFAPADLIFDQSGRIVVVGASRAGLASSSTSRWTVLRLDRTGTSPLDTGFGDGGRRTIPPCDNTSDYGPTGVAMSGTRIVVLGSCGTSAAVAVARLTASEALPGPVALTVTPAREAAGRRRVKLDRIDPTGVIGVLDAIQGAPLRNSPLRNSPLRNSPLRNSPLRNSPLRNSPLRNSPILNFPLRNSGGWADILLGVIDKPLQFVTLGEVLDADPPKLAELTLADVDIESSPLRNVSLAALLLEPRPLSSIPAPAEGWCAALAGQPFNCANGVAVASTSLMDLELAGDKVPYDRPLGLRDITLGSGTEQAELARIKLVDVNLAATPYGAVPASQLSSLLACGGSCTGTLAERQAADPTGFSTATLGDLITHANAPAATLGQLLLGLVARDEIPFERAPLEQLLADAELRAGDLQRHRVRFDVDCGQSAGLRVGIVAPDGARLAPNTATWTVNGGTARSAPAPAQDPLLGVPAFALADPCSGLNPGSVAAIDFSVDLEPGYVLGPVDVAARVATNSSGTPKSAAAQSSVDDSLDAGDTDAGAQPLDADTLVAGHVSSDTDVDDYTFSLPAGSSATVALSQLPADYDLLVFGPELGPATSPLRNSPLRNSPLRNSGTPDASDEPAGDPTVLAPDTVQDLPLRNSPLRNSSIKRGTAEESASVLVRESDAGKTFTVRVAGYNGAQSARPYVLRLKVTPPPPLKPCATRPALSDGLPGTYPATIPGDRETLVLVNRRRYAALHGEAAAARMMDRAGTYAAREDVKGVVVPVESHPTVDAGAAASAWDADPCSVDKGNAYASAVADVVDRAREGLDGLRHVVIVGGDTVIPQFRVPDLAVMANQREYADDAAAGNVDTSVSRAQRLGYALSDNPHGDLDPQARQGSRLYVPDLAVGRLVETPEEIEQAFDRYESSNGTLDIRTANVFGYDFISDGAREMRDALAPVSPDGVVSRIDESWGAADALAALNRPAAAFSAFNAHFDHYRAMPAAANSGADDTLISSDQVKPAPGSLVFTIGCNAGQSVEDAISVLAAGDARLRDWPQQLAQQGAAGLAANTGYGYGDTEAVAYSERLMAEFARNLAAGNATAGQALMLAKQGHIVGTADDYDVKALHIATFYGLPTYRTRQGSEQAAPALPLETTAPSQVTLRSSPLSVSPTLREVPDTTRGRYWEVPGQPPLVVQRRPIQPRLFRDVTAEDGLPVRGFVPEAMTTSEVANVDPVNARPTIDLAEREPEPFADGTIFPAHIAAVDSVATENGRRDRLELVMGQFRDDPDTATGRGTQLLTTSLSGRLLRSDSADWTPPSVLRVEGRIVSGGVAFTVETADADARGGTILYRTDASSAWNRLELAPLGGGRLGGAAVLPGGATRVDGAVASVNDAAGNVGYGRFKARGYLADAVDTPGAGQPRIVFSPAPPASGYYAAPPTATLDPGASAGAAFEYSVDGAAFAPYTGPVAVPGTDGVHLVEVRGSDGSAAAAVVAIDTQPPTVSGTPLTQPNAFGWYSEPVTVRFACADAVSGVASCSPEQETVSTEGRNRTVSATATDRAGRSATGSVGGINLDRTLPNVAVTRPVGGVILGVAGAKLTGTSGDALAGIDEVVVTYTRQGTTETRTEKATLDCDAGRTSCPWSAPAPPFGSWSARATALDRAGHRRESAEVLFSVS